MTVDARVDRGVGKLPKFSLLVAIACGVAVAAIVVAPQRMPSFLASEHWTSDWRTLLLADRTQGPHQSVAVVTINENTLAGLKYRSPIDRGLLADIIKAVDAAEPRAIGLDIYFVQKTEDEKDNALQEAIQRARAQTIVGALDRRGEFQPFQWDYQKAFLSRLEKPAGYINLRTDSDSIVRHRSPPADPIYPESFATLLARAGGKIEAPQSGRIAWLLGPGFGPLPFIAIPAQDILSNHDERRSVIARGLLGQLRGKVVLIGGDIPYSDRHRTPLTTWTGQDISGVMVHANIVAQLLDERSYSELGLPEVKLVLILLVLGGVLLSLVFRQRRVDFLGWTAATIVLVAVDAFIYSQVRVVLPVTLLLCGWILGITIGHHLWNLIAWAWSRRRSPI